MQLGDFALLKITGTPRLSTKQPGNEVTRLNPRYAHARPLAVDTLVERRTPGPTPPYSRRHEDHHLLHHSREQHSGSVLQILRPLGLAHIGSLRAPERTWASTCRASTPKRWRCWKVVPSTMPKKHPCKTLAVSHNRCRTTTAGKSCGTGCGLRTGQASQSSLQKGWRQPYLFFVFAFAQLATRSRSSSLNQSGRIRMISMVKSRSNSLSSGLM